MDSDEVGRIRRVTQCTRGLAALVSDCCFDSEMWWWKFCEEWTCDCARGLAALDVDWLVRVRIVVEGEWTVWERRRV